MRQKTRSFIIIHLRHDRWVSFDFIAAGEPEHIGRTLFDTVTSQGAAERMVQKWTEANDADSLSAVWPEQDSQLVYVWDLDQWWVADALEGTQPLTNLGDVLLGATSLTALGLSFGRLALLNPRQPHPEWT